MQTRECKYQGKRLFYRSGGSGPLVVLLHGFGEDGTIWKGQYDLFPEHTVLVPDLPGSGRSEAIADMSMEGLAEAVLAIIEAEKPPHPPAGGVANTPTLLEQDAYHMANAPTGEVSAAADPPLEGGGAILIGHSMGGYITLAFAEKYPGLLRAFGLFHSTAFADSEEKKETRRKGIRFLEEHGAEEFLKTTIPNLYAPASRAQHPEWIENHLESVHNFSAANLVSYYKAMIQRPDRTAVLKEATIPVLFVMGRHDTAVPLQDGLKQCHLPQLSYIHILENAGHMGMIEESEMTGQILSRFVFTQEKLAST